MPISVSCSQCGRTYQVRDELAGKMAKCPCGQTMTIPKASAPVAVAVVDPPVAPVAPRDPFAGLADEFASQGTTLPPLGKGKKRSGRKGRNPYLIPAIAGGAVLVVLFIVILVVAVSSIGSSTTAGPGVAASVPDAPTVRWPTPEAVFNAQTQAYAQRDWKTLFETAAPTTQRKVNGVLVATLVMMGPVVPELQQVRTEYGFDKLQVSLSDLLLLKTDPGAEHRLKARFEEAADRIPDGAGFFIKIMGIISDEKTNDPRGALRDLRSQIAAEQSARLVDLKPAGDAFTGTSETTFQGRTKREPLRFTKIDGEWRIEDLSL